MDLTGKKIYISGQMNGLSRGQIEEEFKFGEYKLRDRNAFPVSPHRIGVPFMRYEELMRIDFKVIDLCDGVLMLDNWVDSAGAKRERAYAIAAGKPVYEVNVMGEIEEMEI